MDTFYPPVSFFFEVKFTGVSDEDLDVRFQSVSGLSVDLLTETHKEGGENRFEYILPVRTKYQNLTLKRGLVKDSKLISWCLKTFQSLDIRPADLTITLFNEKQEPLMVWNVVQAWPKKWSVDDLNAMDSKVLIESLELQYNYYTVNNKHLEQSP
jgi:phage tail-like protein